MGKVPDPAIVIDRRTGVYDRAVAYDRSGIDNGSCHYNTSLADRGRFGHYSARMDKLCHTSAAANDFFLKHPAQAVIAERYEKVAADKFFIISGGAGYRKTGRSVYVIIEKNYFFIADKAGYFRTNLSVTSRTDNDNFFIHT
jgi:hypothetical protein